MGWVVNATPRPLYPRERPGTHCTGGWVDPRAGLDRCGKCRPHRDSIPGPSSPSRVAGLNKSTNVRPSASYTLDSPDRNELHDDWTRLTVARCNQTAPALVWFPSLFKFTIFRSLMFPTKSNDFSPHLLLLSALRDKFRKFNAAMTNPHSVL